MFPVAGDTDQDSIAIMGRKDEVEKAKVELESLIQNLVSLKLSDDKLQLIWRAVTFSRLYPQFEYTLCLIVLLQDKIVEEEVSVDPKYHRHFVARRGEILRQIGDDFGGVTVSFPRSGVKSDRVVIKGAKDCVQGAKKRLLEIVDDLVRT